MRVMRSVWTRLAAGAALALGLSSAPQTVEAQEELCSDPQTFCGKLLSPRCLSSYGAGSISAAQPADCEASFAEYRDCLASVAETCGGETGSGLSSVQQEAAESLEGLTRLGGLIPEPGTVVEFYNNAFVFERRGDTLNARRMYEKAIAAGAEAVDLHLRYLAVLKAQEGLIGAREIYADIARRNAENNGAQLAAALLAPAPSREAALRALVAGDDAFAPAWYEIANLFSAARLGTQSLTDRQAEKAALEAFDAADERGQVYRWFLEKAFAEAWRLDAASRLAVYESRAVDIDPVTLTATPSNDSWIVVLNLVEPARAIRYRVDGGPVQDTGLTATVNPVTGAPQPKTFFNLSLKTNQALIEVWYDDVREQEQGPFPLQFNSRLAFVASSKSTMDMVTQWVQGRDFDDKFLVYFTHLASHRCGIAKIEYGVNRDEPNEVWPLAPCDPRNPYSVGEDAKIYEVYPAKLEKMVVRLTYADGETSELRTFTFD